jgi:hypothetical protein
MGTNAFFEEQTLVISVGGNTRESELVSFLWNLGNKNSLIRVSSMNLRPDPSKLYLFGGMTLVKSFQRKGSAKPASRPASPAEAPSSAAAPPPAATNAARPATPATAPPPSSEPAAASPAPAAMPATDLPKRQIPTPIPPK